MRSATLRNKMIYGALILVIFVAMMPYSKSLERLKQEYDLGEAQIGQVDTGGFIMNLLLLGGSRGLVANALWMQAQELQKAQEYDKLNTRVEFITKLQPHFHTVWTYQGWNLAYNVSVEWDDPKDKYEWIKRGIKFLKRGVEKNQKTPDLLWDTAWTYYHKLGFADEAIFLRRLVHDDPDESFRSYNNPRNRDQPVTNLDDNFQIAFGWFLRSQDLVDKIDDSRENVAANVEQKIKYIDAPEQHKGKPGDLAFHNMPSHALTKYAVYLEKESKLGIDPTFGERAQIAWASAHREWKTFGRRKFDAFNDPDQNIVYLDDVLDAKNEERFPPAKWYWTDRWAHQMNYPYWEGRCRAEQEADALQARQLFHEGRKGLKLGDFSASVRNYRTGLEQWKTLLDKYPQLARDELNREDTGQIVNYYLRALKQNGEDVPGDTPFLELGKLYKDNRSVDPFDLLHTVPDTMYREIKEKFGIRSTGAETEQ